MTGNDKGHVKVRELFSDAAVIHRVINTTLCSFLNMVERGKPEVQSMPYSYIMITMTWRSLLPAKSVAIGYGLERETQTMPYSIQ